MDEEKIILSCQECVENLVRKYNNHELDEDLKSVGMIAVVECVKRSLAEHMTDVSQIQARCNVWAKNRILNEIYAEKLKCDDNFNLDDLESEDDIEYSNLKISVMSSLSDVERTCFDLLLKGETPENIMKKLNVAPSTYRGYVTNIKKLLKISSKKAN